MSDPGINTKAVRLIETGRVHSVPAAGCGVSPSEDAPPSSSCPTKAVREASRRTADPRCAHCGEAFHPYAVRRTVENALAHGWLNRADGLECPDCAWMRSGPDASGVAA